ncbi:outer membrane beta-barrel protein [Sphingobacterium griseoflavum]|nr:outer membrane beta-barrel protein [Sphingobacterium griseoflavum]
MKKNLLTVVLVFGAVAATSAQSTFGVRTGLNLATEYVRQNNQSSTTKIAPSFHLTGYYDARVSPGFSIQPGLSLQGKGGKSDLGGEVLTDKLLYLEVPVNFLGRVQAGNGEVFFGGGPYIAYGVSARVTSGRNARHLAFGKEPDQLNPFDAGLGFMTGYRFAHGLVLSLSSSAGFVNIGNIEGTTFQNRVTSFSIGYEFSKR